MPLSIVMTRTAHSAEMNLFHADAVPGTSHQCSRCIAWNGSVHNREHFPPAVLQGAFRSSRCDIQRSRWSGQSWSHCFQMWCKKLLTTLQLWCRYQITFLQLCHLELLSIPNVMPRNSLQCSRCDVWSCWQCSRCGYKMAHIAPAMMPRIIDSAVGVVTSSIYSALAVVPRNVHNALASSMQIFV